VANAYHNKAVLYDLLFRAAAETLLTIAADPKHLGGRIGATAVLHSWGATMTHHPSCAVSGHAGRLSEAPVKEKRTSKRSALSAAPIDSRWPGRNRSRCSGFAIRQ
jgi:hypothetical protein